MTTTLENPAEAIARLDAIGRTRALTDGESLYLERLIRAERSAKSNAAHRRAFAERCPL